MSAPLPFSEALAPVAPALHAWARLKARGPLTGIVEPEDLAQEVCYQAYRGYERFDAERAPFRAWLFGVAHHVLKMALRSAARAHARAGSVEVLASRADQLPDEATTITRRVARDEALAAFVEAVEGLDDEDRQLLVWRGLEGLRHAEVAALLGCNEENAKKRWQRLRARVKDLPAAERLLG